MAICIENEIVGEALVALKHDELKEMAIVSVGHRLTILKGVYDVKVKQEVPIESDHYIPPCTSKIGCIHLIYTDSRKPPMPAYTTRTLLEKTSRE